jgi:hypothetical protein
VYIVIISIFRGEWMGLESLNYLFKFMKSEEGRGYDPVVNKLTLRTHTVASMIFCFYGLQSGISNDHSSLRRNQWGSSEKNNQEMKGQNTHEPPVSLVLSEMHILLD